MGRCNAPGLTAATVLVDKDGSVRSEPLLPGDQVALYSDFFHWGQRGLIELVRATRTPEGQLGMRSRRFPAGYLDASELPRDLPPRRARTGKRGEYVFANPLPRERM